MNLRDLLSQAAADLPDVDRANGPGGETIWSQASRPFAILHRDGTAASFGLDPGVAKAAVRTPDVVPSEQGDGWVRFSPSILDHHGADRAAAWFASAHRRRSRG